MNAEAATRTSAPTAINVTFKPPPAPPPKEIEYLYFADFVEYVGAFEPDIWYAWGYMC
ncbi:MAG: hypothetical protein ACP6IP_01000 [Candidatus Njordarchaeia archaeon]